MLSPPVAARVSASNKTYTFLHIFTFPLRSCGVVLLFPCRNHSTGIKVPAFQKISSDLCGVNKKVVYFESVGLSSVETRVFSCCLQSLFCWTLAVFSLILFGRTSPVTSLELCCSDSTGGMWLCSREFIWSLVRTGVAGVQQNKPPWILADVACGDHKVSWELSTLRPSTTSSG